jgi:two-component system CheB/CheR fusion protein
VATILIVDDNVEIANGMALWLQRCGRKVLTAHDGHSAVDLAHEHLPEVIVLDIGLPGKDGNDVTRELRRNPVMRASLIIAITGYGLPARARAFEAGVDHFFVKPADLHKVAELVNERLGGA